MSTPHRSSAAQARRRRRPLRWGLAFLLVLAVAAAAVVILTRGVSWRDRVPITHAELREPDLLLLVVNTCGAEPELDLLDEQKESVEVAVVSTRTIGGPGSGDCLDAVEVRLQAPIGDRSLIDVTSGDELTLST